MSSRSLHRLIPSSKLNRIHETHLTRHRFRRLVADIANIEAGKTVVMAYHGMFREKSASDNQKSEKKNLSVAAAGDRFAKAATAASNQDADMTVKSAHICGQSVAKPGGTEDSASRDTNEQSKKVCFDLICWHLFLFCFDLICWHIV